MTAPAPSGTVGAPLASKRGEYSGSVRSFEGRGTRHRSSFISPAVLVVAALLAGLLAPAAAAADDEVIVESKRLRPPVVKTTTSSRVTFINRTGRIARLEFPGTAGDHRVFEVPVQLWVVFDRHGRHPYVVHFGTGADAVTLRGTVEVVKKGTGSVDPPTCDSVALPGMKVMGECIAW